ncbi:unnamed protein product, partial [Adineta steineri]
MQLIPCRRIGFTGKQYPSNPIPWDLMGRVAL